MLTFLVETKQFILVSLREHNGEGISAKGTPGSRYRGCGFALLKLPSIAEITVFRKKTLYERPFRSKNSAHVAEIT